MTGIGPTTKSERLNQMNVTWEKDRWYIMTNELIANVDG